MIIKRSLLIVLLFFLQLEIKAQEQVSLEDFGLSFTVPAGWTGDIQGEYLVLGHTTIPGMMILMENPATTIQSLIATAQKGIQADGFNFTTDGTFKTINSKRAEGYYKGTYEYSTKVKAYAVGLIDGQGKGMSIIILTETGVFSDAHINAANQLAKPVKLLTPKAPAITKQWQERLVGKKLTYRDTRGGINGTRETRIITLCPNGTFTFYFDSNVSFDGPGGFGYANSNEDSRGNYTIYSVHNDSYLTLNFDNGKEIEYTLTLDSEGYPVLEGTKFIALDAEVCD